MSWHKSTWRGGSLPPCCVEKCESTRRGGFDPPCCVDQRELMRRGGLSPPCRVDARATRGPNPPGFGYPRNPRDPYPYPSKPVPVSGYGFQAGVGAGTRRVTHGLPVTGPIDCIIGPGVLVQQLSSGVSIWITIFDFWLAWSSHFWYY